MQIIKRETPNPNKELSNIKKELKIHKDDIKKLKSTTGNTDSILKGIVYGGEF